MDMSKPRAYVEHAEHGTKMIYLDEREEYLKNGWFKPGEKPEAEEEKPTVNESLTVEKNLDEMEKPEMEQFIKDKNLDVNVTSKMNKYVVRSKIKKALNDNSASDNQ